MSGIDPVLQLKAQMYGTTLQRAGSAPSSSSTASSAPAAAAAPVAASASESNTKKPEKEKKVSSFIQCKGTVKSGDQCKNRAATEGYCPTHWKLLHPEKKAPANRPVMTEEEKKKAREERKKSKEEKKEIAKDNKKPADKKEQAPAVSADAPAPGAAAAGDKKDEKAADDLTVKVPKGTRDILPEQMIIREKAFALIKGVFMRHGAVQIDTPVFELKETLTNKYGEDSKLIYELADQGGELLALRYDLTVPFARYLATHGASNIKRFHIGRVYRRDNPAMTRGRFREFYQCDFDIAGYEVSPPMLPDAECLKVLVEILDDLNIGRYTIKLNHRKLLDGIMGLAGVPVDKFRPICSAIDKLDKEPWSAVKNEMVALKGLDEKVADKIGEFVLLNGSPRALLTQLQKDAGLSSNAQAKAAFQDLSAMIDFMDAFGILPRITLDMSLARGLDYYTGVIYEAVLLSEVKDGEEEIKLGSIAAGGRYDNLVGMFSTKPVPAVGVSVGIERIFNLLEQLERKKGPIRKNYTKVQICSVGKDMLIPKMKIANELWAANIPAEYFYHANPKPKPQMEDVMENGVPFVIWIGADELMQNVVKVKNVATRAEELVSRNQLVQYLKKIIDS